MVKHNARKAVIIVLAVFLIIGVYLTGFTHGKLRTSAIAGTGLLCDELGNGTILPYGCKMESGANYCAVSHCLDSNNFALCVKYNETIGFSDRLQAAVIGISLIGCPLTLEPIGINPVTGNENWKFRE